MFHLSYFKLYFYGQNDKSILFQSMTIYILCHMRICGQTFFSSSIKFLAPPPTLALSLTMILFNMLSVFCIVQFHLLKLLAMVSYPFLTSWQPTISSTMLVICFATFFDPTYMHGCTSRTICSSLFFFLSIC